MQLDKMKAKSGLSALAFGATLVVAGCGGDPTATYAPTTTVTPRQRTPIRPNADAGIRVEQAQDPTRFPTLVAMSSRRFPTRPDPFALTRREASFERSQRTELLFQEGGEFGPQFSPQTDPPVIIPVVEPQPYRRLSGIVVGDSVLALIDMGDGAGPQIIRPGLRIPNSPWRVISIDEEKAVLRRDGDVLPRQITVRLEVPPPGFNDGSGGVPGGPGAPGDDEGGPPGRGGGARPGSIGGAPGGSD